MKGHYLTEIKERVETKKKTLTVLKEPRMYKVLLVNDDYTPMDFVVLVLKQFFHFNDVLATEVMLQVHNQGRGMCGVFTHEIAETKVVMVNDYSRSNQHPLLCTMEPI